MRSPASRPSPRRAYSLGTIRSRRVIGSMVFRCTFVPPSNPATVDTLDLSAIRHGIGMSTSMGRWCHSSTDRKSNQTRKSIP
jgi:hypothetical protein